MTKGRGLLKQPPASKHGEVIQPFHTTFLNGHRPTNHHPALGLIRGDTDWFIGSDTCQATYILNIPSRLILIGRSPLIDNRPDGKQPILMIISSCEQVEGIFR